MTKEDAIKELKEYEDGLDLEYATPFDKAILYAIKALSQEPCDDVISREAVIEWLENATYEDISYAVGTELSFLPSVTQKSGEMDS